MRGEHYRSTELRISPANSHSPKSQLIGGPVETPAPNPTDPEDVVTALEAAAIFAAKGDTPEAARWLGRAADFASLSGNGSRAEALARSARALSEARSDSNDELDSPPPLPTPPPRRVSVRPVAPSERPSDASQPMLLVRPASSTPSPPVARAPAAPESARALTPAPSSVGPSPAVTTPRPSVRPQSNAAVAMSPSRTPAPATASTAPAASTSPAASAASVASAAPLASAPSSKEKESQEVSAVREASPRASAPPKPVENSKPAPKPSLHHELHRPFRLQGARVSISASQGSSRFYVLKVLEDGEPVPPGEHEAFLVLSDPNSAR
jgi:hypothetical protein